MPRRRANSFSAQAVLFFAGLAAGIYQFFHLSDAGFGHGFEMVAIARSLAQHGTYANPFAPFLTGPTSLVPPLYPLFLAALIKLSGSLIGMALLADVANIAANAAIAAVLPRLSEIFFDDWAPGVFAGALWIGSMRLMPQWDATFTILGLELFCVFAAATIREGRSPFAAALWAGLLAGMLMLLNPATAMAFLPWTAFLLYSRRLSWRYSAKYAAALLAATGLCLMPWIVRNYEVWHTFVVRTSFGTTLYCSNNPCAQSSLDKDAANGCFQATHPVASAAEAGLVREFGELEYDRMRKSDALRWIAAHPARFTALTAQRTFEFWFPAAMEITVPVCGIWLSTLLSIPGIVLMLRRRIPASIFVAAVWLLYPPMYYIVVTCDRYRYPILWTSLLPAGYALFRFCSMLAAVLSMRLGRGAGPVAAQPRSW